MEFSCWQQLQLQQQQQQQRQQQRPLLPCLGWLNNKGAQLDLTLAQSHRSPSQNGFRRRRRPQYCWA